MVRAPPLLPLPLPSRKATCDQRECSTQHVATAPVLGDPLYSSNHLSYIPGVGVQRGLYLHSSHVSFHVSPHRLPSTSRHPFTSSPLSIPTGIDLLRPLAFFHRQVIYLHSLITQNSFISARRAIARESTASASESA